MGFNLSELGSVDPKEMVHNHKPDISVEDGNESDIAIIGISVNLPGAQNNHEFWDNLKRKKDFITSFPEARRKDIDNYLSLDSEIVPRTEYFQAAYLDEVDKFDYNFFRLTPGEAKLMSPVQRLFLETAYKTVEDAGYGGNKIIGSKTGVFVGYIGDITGDTYEDLLSRSDSSLNPGILTGNMSSMLPSRISYYLDLKGPSVVVDTACSSSLVAVHMACQSIKTGECDMAIAGGIKLFLVPVQKIRLGLDSSSGRSKAFDNSADGIGVGEGSAAIMLKPLGKALRDRDPIYAVIKGSAANQDGHSIGITAPNVAEQANVIANAWKNARINPETITYIEAHGTGTKLGDPIEIEGIKRAFERFTDKKQFCAIGSLKSNYGHLNDAAGIAGLIKLVLSLRHGEIPPTLHFDKPNRNIAFEASPVYVNDQLAQWDCGEERRRGGISSFGFSGTNCHMVVEEPPVRSPRTAVYHGGPSVLTLSSKSKSALDRLLVDYRDFLIQNPNVNLRDICYTTNTGRDHYQYRLAIIASKPDELLVTLRNLCSNSDGYEAEHVFYNYFKPVHRSITEVREGDVSEEELAERSKLAQMKIKEFVRTGKNDPALLSQICRLYTNGARIQWMDMYERETPLTVNLPTYSFDRERCWCEISDTSSYDSVTNLLQPFYSMVWERKALEEGPKDKDSKTVILISHPDHEYGVIESRLKAEGNRVISVTASANSSFEELSIDRYVMDLSEHSFEMLFRGITSTNPVQIVYLPASEVKEGADSLYQLDQHLELGVYSLFRLARTIKHLEAPQQVQLVLVARNVCKAVESDLTIVPENSTMLGLAKVVNREHPELWCKVIDADPAFTLDQLLEELNAGELVQHVAYRNNHRYLESLHPLELEQKEKTSIQLKEDGVYLITGGLSGIGYEFAKYAVSSGKVQLIIMNRSEMPEREAWDELIRSGTDKKQCERIAAIRELKESGYHIEYISADISNEEQVRDALQRVKAKYTRINGIIHSAGLSDDCLISQQNKEDFEAILRPKVHGTWLLNRYTSQESLDFFILFSSVATLIPAPGQGDYAAANAYLDAFSDYRRAAGKNALTIQWVAWKETGMAKEKGFTADTIFKSLSTVQALDCFEQVLDRDISQVLIGEMNTDNKLVLMLEHMPFGLSEDIRIRLKQLRSHTTNFKPAGSGLSVKLRGKENEQYSRVEQQVANICMSVLGFKDIDIYDNFFDLGADSISLTHMFEALNRDYPGKLSLTKVFAYPSIAALAEYLSEQSSDRSGTSELEGAGRNAVKQGDKDTDIAIIGIGTCMPTGTELDEFWEQIRTGQDLIQRIPDSRRKDVEQYLRIIGKEVSEGDFMEAAYLDRIDTFDYKFFKLSPKEASLMDPNQRKFLETSWTAIEDAGYGGDRLKGTNTGVFVGFSQHPLNSYIDFIAKTRPEDLPVSLSGNLTSIIPSRVSYLLDLKGPSILVDTACSSSLVAVHMACKSLLSGECNTALAGGVKINILPLMNELKIGIESSTSRTRAFDDASDGTGVGEGVVCIVLKPLNKAMEDQDHVYAVIKGSAVNQDGTSVGITAPNVNAQAEVILQAWEDSKVDPATISYIEAHGTGTKLGDPIEMEALDKAFRKYTDKKAFCAVSTVKSNMGHLYEAAGIAGLLKVVLSLKHKTLAPSIHYVTPNREINFEDSAHYVNDKLKPWEVISGIRRSGVSSFGFSGTNCHIVLEEAMEAAEVDTEGDINPQVLCLSAKSEAALLKLVHSYGNFLEKHGLVRLMDICYTANTGRAHHPYRLAIVATSSEQLKDKIQDVLRNGLVEQKGGGIVFGKHALVMADKEILQPDELRPKDKNALSLQAGLLIEQLKVSGIRVEGLLDRLSRLYVKGADITWNTLYEGNGWRRISLPTYPFENHRCWIDMDTLEPQAVSLSKGQIIHPLLEKLVVESMDQMVFVTDFSPNKHFVLRDHIIMGSYVLPGTTYVEMIVQVAKRVYPDLRVALKDITFYKPLVLQENATRELQTIIKPGVDGFEFAIVSKDEGGGHEPFKQWIKHAEGRFVSHQNSGGFSYDIEDLKEQCGLRQISVNQNELSDGFITFGPRWLNYHTIRLGEETALAEISLPEEFLKDMDTYDMHPCLLDMAAAAYCFISGKRYLPLSYKGITIFSKMPPSFYSFIKKIHRGANDEVITFDIDLVDQNGHVFAEIAEFSLKKVHEFKTYVRDNILTHTKWALEESVEGTSLPISGLTLVISDRHGEGAELAGHIKALGGNVAEAEFGHAFEKINENHFRMAGTQKDFEDLVLELKEKGLTRIVHVLRTEEDRTFLDQQLDGALNRGMYSLVYLLQSLVRNGLKDSLELVVITRCANEVTGEEGEFQPLHAAVTGMCKVIGNEHQGIRVKCIDIDLATGVDRIVTEILTPGSRAQVALRGNKRYICLIERLNIEELPDQPFKIREQGVYVITGGAGGLGLEIAEHLARTAQVKLALIGRRDIPSRARWADIIEQQQGSKLADCIQAVLEMESMGSEVLYCCADISNVEEAQAAFDTIRAEFGTVNGIIHAAGVAGSGYMFMKEKEDLLGVIRPKIHGTIILDNLSAKDQPDFMVLFSSIASVLAYPGQGDYTAANSFLNAFAAWRNRQGRNTVSINWSAWKETGMALDHGVNSDTMFKTLATSEALSAFDEIIHKKLSSVIVGELNPGYEGESSDTLASTLLAKVKKRQQQGGGLKAVEQEEAVIIIKGMDGGVEPDELESRLSSIWAKVLGMREINVYESFYDMGGDSILATQLFREMDREFPGMIDIADIFSYSSVSQLAGYMKGKIDSSSRVELQQTEARSPGSTKHNINISDSNPVENSQIEDVLDKLIRGEISMEDADKEMKTGGNH